MENRIFDTLLGILSFGIKGLTKWLWKKEYSKRGRKGATVIPRVYLSIFVVFVTSIVLCVLIFLLNVKLSPRSLMYFFIVVAIWFSTIWYQTQKMLESPLSSGKKIKSIEDIETALGSGEEGVPFKFGWLNKKDVQQSVRRDEVDELKKLFKKHRAILLEGPPASGKTVIAKQFGLEMAKKGYFVYYANLTVRRGLGKNAKGENVTPETLPNELKEELLGNLNVDIYIIIEDIHNYLSKYDAMNWAADSKNKIKLLLVSRPIREHVFTGERQLKSKKTEQFSWAHKFEIKGDQVLPQIVERAQKIEGIHFNDIEKIKKFVKGNLYLLIFAIKASEENSKLLDDIDKADIRKQVVDYILGDEKPFKSLLGKASEKFGNRQLSNTQKNEFKEILKFLSVISQYELPVREETLAKYLGLRVDDVEKYMEPLVNYGDIVKIKRQDFISNSYMVPHSKLAESMTDVLINPDTSLLDEKLEILKFYLKYDDYPGTLIYRVMHGEDKELSRLLLSYLDESDFEDIKNKNLDLIEISSILCIFNLDFLVSFYIIHKKILADVLNNLREKFIKFFENQIRNVSYNSQNPADIGIFFYRLSMVNRTLAKDIIDQLEEESDLTSISLKNSDIRDIGKFIQGIAMVNKELAKKIISQHKNDISTSLKNTHIKYIGYSIVEIAWANTEVAEEIIRHHKDKLGKILRSISHEEWLDFWSVVGQWHPEFSFKILTEYFDDLTQDILESAKQDFLSKLCQPESSFFLLGGVQQNLKKFIDLLIQRYGIKCESDS